nr:tetratricopeptide repeat protein [candidate division Zixibacteria bacterium]
MSRIKSIILFFIILLLNAVAVSADQPDSLFASGNGYYQAEQFDSALAIYQRLEKKNYSSAELFFNIGNCYFKKGDLGYAILYYLRAERLQPNDDDIQANLDFARQFMPTRLEGVKINPVSEFMKTLVKPVTLDTAAWISSLLFILMIFSLIIIVYFQMRGSAVKITAISLVVMFIIGAGLTTYKFRSEYLEQTGVIVAQEPRILSAPTDNGELEFNGNFGLTFIVEKSVEDYYLVIFENKRKGWIKREDVELL